MFVIPGFRYLEVLFHIFCYYWGKENRSLYRGRSSLRGRRLKAGREREFCEREFQAREKRGRRGSLYRGSTVFCAYGYILFSVVSVFLVYCGDGKVFLHRREY